MSPERGAPSLSIEHWDFQMARKAGHSEMAEMGMFVDVAVLRMEGEIVGVEKVGELKIHWEKFKREEDYAQAVLQSAGKLIKDREAARRVAAVFHKWQHHFVSESGRDPEEAARMALFETLYTTGLNEAKLELFGLDRKRSGKIAGALIEVAKPFMKKVVTEFTGNGGSMEVLNFMDPRAKRILALARRNLQT